MNTNILKQVVYGLALLVGIVSSSSCRDDITDLGFSTQPPSEKIQAQGDTLLLQARTIAMEEIYTRSTSALLGQISDPFFGSLKSSYATQMRHAPGFKTKQSPIDGKIDSVHLLVSYNGVVGDTTLWSKIAAYELKQPLPESRYTGDLSPYLQGAQMIGELTFRPQPQKGYGDLFIPVDVTLGQRIFDASLQHPEYFETQKSFQENLLQGVYLTVTTGSGTMLSSYNTSLLAYYTYMKNGKSKDGKRDSTYREVGTFRFSNTNQLYTRSQFDHSNRDNLLKANTEYAYLNTPQGVLLEVTLSGEALQKYVAQKGVLSKKRIFNEARITLQADLPPSGKTMLQPPRQLLLLPHDKYKDFFEKGETPTTQESAFLSNEYNTITREYTFSNISPLIMAHVNRAIEKGEPVPSIKLYILPIMHEGGKKGAPVKISQILYPTGVRLKLHEGGIKMGLIHTTIH